MSISLDVDRVAGEAQRVVVQSMDDYYASPMFNLDVCTDFENNSVCRSRVPSECSSDLSSLDTGIETGIEAQDLNSLLDQFEEASCGFGDFPTSTAGTASVTASPQDFPTSTAGTASVTASPQVSRPETPVTQVQPIIDRTEDVIQKIKSSTKRKSAILLPMGVPAKRGRGQALALSSCLAPRTLQKIIKSSSVDDCVVNTVGVQFVDADRITSPVQVEPPAKNIPEVVEVSEQYYNSITDHDYCQNFPKVDVDSEESTTTTVNEKNEEEEKENGQDEESEENGHFSKFQSERPKSAFFKRYEDIREKRRIYRKKQQETPAFQDDEQYYDRIPKYFSVLSKPVKRVKSSSAINIDINDSLPERDPSPERASNEKLFNKLPAYHNCFTNSSKYDINSGNQPSVQSSRSSSPLLIDSRAPSRSRSNSAHSSCSRRSASSQSSRSRSRSRSRNDRRSSGYSSRHSTRRRSRSQSRGRTRSRRGRRRRSSYSSSSRSRSYSRSRSPLSDRGRSKDRSRSRERYYKDLEKQREEEKRKQIEERRIVYVGKIPRDFTRRNLRSLFTKFGEIEETSVHFREAGDNYGFVTFGYTCDAYAAVEKGNKVPGCEHFDLCFGGRRHFCKNDYADLDGDNEIQEEFTPQSRKKTHEPNFDDLLQQAIRNAKRK